VEPKKISPSKLAKTFTFLTKNTASIIMSTKPSRFNHSMKDWRSRQMWECKYWITPGTDVMITIFCDFRQFSAEKLAFFSKTNVLIKIVHNLTLFWVKNANFFAENIRENILKIITSVPGREMHQLEDLFCKSKSIVIQHKVLSRFWKTHYPTTFSIIAVAFVQARSGFRSRGRVFTSPVNARLAEHILKCDTAYLVSAAVLKRNECLFRAQNDPA
jgi:hypothetical protein